jgi:tetratricopeptide (TPR) repeat protein
MTSRSGWQTCALVAALAGSAPAIGATLLGTGVALAQQGATGARAALIPARVEVQAVSLLGDTLRAAPFAPATKARYEAQLGEARRAYERAPANLDSIVWYGRRLAYLGQLREAIAVYTRGLELYPDNPWLLRHRGHRYISVRDFERAVQDLERAAAVVEGQPDVIEPDGQPNPAGVPIGTLHSNIGYHLALAHYLRGEWTKAAAVARKELAAATNDDRRVSMAHWLYMALRRAGRDTEAAQAIAPFRRPLTIVENQSYERLLRLYLGDSNVEAESAGGAAGPLSASDASLAYGIANWHFYNGRTAEAIARLEALVRGGQWGAFGAIAAEADLARIRGKR